MESKHILVICGELSAPDREQKQELYRRLGEAGLRFRCLSFLAQDSAQSQQLNTHFESVDFIAPKPKTRMGWLETIKKASGLFAGPEESSGLDILIPDGTKQKIEELYQKYRPRSVVCESVLLSACLSYFPSHVPTLIFGHECERAEQLGMAEADLSKAYSRAGFVLARTASEREKLTRICSSTVLSVGSLVEEMPQPVTLNSKIAILPHGEGTEKPQFAGELSEYLPALLEVCPDARFVINEKIEGASFSDRCEVVSYSDPATFYKDCMLVFNPYAGDDSVTDHILRAMACGRAVISTTAGARGLRGASGMGVFIADNAEQLRASLGRLIGSELILKKAAESAFRFVHAYNRGTLSGLVKAMTQ